MARPCKICTHPERDGIDQALLSGEPNRRVATRCGVSEAGVRRHKAHIGAAIREAQAEAERRQVQHGLSLLERAEQLSERALGILAKAEDSNRLQIAVAALRECREQISLLARLKAAPESQGWDTVEEWQVCWGNPPGGPEQPGTSPPETLADREDKPAAEPQRQG